MFYSSSVFQDLSSISTAHKLFRDIGDLGVTKDLLCDGQNTPKNPHIFQKYLVQRAETLAETIESDPLCIADLFQKFFIYDQFLIKFLIFFLALYYVTFQCGCKNIFIKIRK